MKKKKLSKQALPESHKQSKLLLVRMTPKELKAVKKAAVREGDIYMTRYVKRIVKEAIG